MKTIDEIELNHKAIKHRVVDVMEDVLSHYEELTDSREVIVALGRLILLSTKCTEPHVVSFLKEGAKKEEEFLLTQFKDLKND